MKRSEMVELIHSVISSVLLTESEFDRDDCSRLLTELEKAGMLPPVSQLEGLGTKDCAWEKE